MEGAGGKGFGRRFSTDTNKEYTELRHGEDNFNTKQGRWRVLNFKVTQTKLARTENKEIRRGGREVEREGRGKEGRGKGASRRGPGA